METAPLITKRVSFFAALCMALSLVELAIPKPLPFMRLGLANLPLLLALTFFTAKEYYLLVVLKIFVQALVSGTFFSYVFLFSVCGTFASAITMYLCTRLLKRWLSSVGVSTLGSLANAAVQYALSLVILFGDGAAYIAPLLFASALVTGVLLGLVANYTLAHSAFIASLRSVPVGAVPLCVAGGGAASATATDTSAADGVAPDAPDASASDTAPETGAAGVLESPATKTGSTSEAAAPATPQTSAPTQPALAWSVVRFALFLAGIIVLCFVRNTYVALGVMLVAFVVTATVRTWNGKRVRILQPLFIFAGVLFFALLVPNGKILFMLGKWRITQGALLSGVRRGSILLGSVFLSQLAFSRELHIPGRLGESVSVIFSYFGKITEAVPRKQKKSGASGKTENRRLKDLFSELDAHLTRVYSA